MITDYRVYLFCEQAWILRSFAAGRSYRWLRLVSEAQMYLVLFAIFNESVVGRRTYPARGCGISRFGSIPKFYQLMIRKCGQTENAAGYPAGYLAGYPAGYPAGYSVCPNYLIMN